MSLLSKKSLNTLFTHINLETTNATVMKNNSEQLVSTVRFTAYEYVTSLDNSLELKLPVTIKEAMCSLEDKRLDNNNNKNKNSSKLQQLSPVCLSESHSLFNSSNVTLFTKIGDDNSTNKKSELCKTCGQITQLERFHSYPKNLMTKSTKSFSQVDTSTSMSNVHTRAEASSNNFRKRLTRAEQQVEPFSSVMSMMSNEKKTIEEPVKDCAKIPKLGEEKFAVLARKRRPKRVTCYICGREFGTASFPIHEPTCLQKWHRENMTLSNSQRRNVPQRPNLPIDHEDWNNAAWEQSQALLIPCRKCKRTFLPDRLTIHERNCRISNKKNLKKTNSVRERVRMVLVVNLFKDSHIIKINSNSRSDNSNCNNCNINTQIISKNMDEIQAAMIVF